MNVEDLAHEYSKKYTYKTSKLGAFYGFIAGYEATTTWINCSEMMPEYTNKRVLIFIPRGHIIVPAYYIKEERGHYWTDLKHNWSLIEVTHWLPTPELPGLKKE